MSLNLMPGQEVKIAYDIQKTHDKHNLDEDGTMLNMRGRTFKIDRIVAYDSILINNFYWHPDDLIPTNIEESTCKPTIVLFDIKNLVV